jgi:hypothetical protein
MNAVEVLGCVVLCQNLWTSVTPILCTFIVTEISRFMTRTTRLHLTENKGLAHEAIPLTSTRFVQADGLLLLQMCFITDYSQQSSSSEISNC